MVVSLKALLLSPLYQVNRGLGEPQSQSEHCGEGNIMYRHALSEATILRKLTKVLCLLELPFPLLLFK
jgi:hypothetical protein